MGVFVLVCVGVFVLVCVGVCMQYFVWVFLYSCVGVCQFFSLCCFETLALICQGPRPARGGGMGIGAMGISRIFRGPWRL